MADDPTVTVKYSDYTKLREDLRETSSRILVLEQEVAAAKLGDPAGVTKQLHDAFHEAFKIVQFAVGNLPPETITGWPHEALVAVAKAIEIIPGIDIHVREVPAELRHFARQAAALEEDRKQRKANRVVVRASPEDFGPKTAEAVIVHAAYAAARGQGATTEDGASKVTDGIPPQ